MTPSVLAMRPGPVLDGPARGPDPVTDTFAAELDRAVAERPEPRAEHATARDAGDVDRGDPVDGMDAGENHADSGHDVTGVDHAGDDRGSEVDDSTRDSSEHPADEDAGNGNDAFGSDAGDSTDRGDAGSDQPNIAFAAEVATHAIPDEPADPAAESAAVSAVSDGADPTAGSTVTGIPVASERADAPSVIASVLAEVGSEEAVGIVHTVGEQTDTFRLALDGSAVVATPTETFTASDAATVVETIVDDAVLTTVASASADGDSPVEVSTAKLADTPIGARAVDAEAAPVDAGETAIVEEAHAQDVANTGDADANPELLAQRLVTARSTSNAAGSSPTAPAAAVDARAAAVSTQLSSPTGTSATGRADQPAMRASIERVMATLDVIAKQPPPRVLTLDLTELHGVRVTLSLDEGSVNVTVADSGAGDAHARQWQDQLDDLLDERDFESGSTADAASDSDPDPISDGGRSTGAGELRL